VVEIELPAGESARWAADRDPGQFRTWSRRLVATYVMPKALSDPLRARRHVFSRLGRRRQAVARMIFHEKGHDYLCTGTLLADLVAASAIPYFLTANTIASRRRRCIDAEYRLVLSLHRMRLRRGADSRVTLTGGRRGSTRAATPTRHSCASMTRRRTAPDFAGWIVGPAPTVGTDITGIHHPAGRPAENQLR
jgi:hypothetical protein